MTERIRVPEHLTVVRHRHRAQKVLPRYHKDIDLEHLPPVIEASELPPVDLEMQLADNMWLVAHCELCDLLFYNDLWWERGRNEPRVLGIRKRWQGGGVMQLEGNEPVLSGRNA